MPENLGSRLRQERERRQIALVSIASDTKISLSLLEGLERDDVSHWPSGIFRRSFLRAYVRAIGLDPDPVLREFLERYPDPGEGFTSANVASGRARASAPSAEGRPPTRLGTLLAAAARRRQMLNGRVVDRLRVAMATARRAPRTAHGRFRALQATSTSRFRGLQATAASRLRALQVTAASRFRALQATSTSRLRGLQATSTSRFRGLQAIAASRLRALQVTSTSRLRTLQATSTSRLCSLQVTSTSRLRALQVTSTSRLRTLQATSTSRLRALQATSTSRLRALQATSTSRLRALHVTSTSRLRTLQDTSTSFVMSGVRRAQSLYRTSQGTVSRALQSLPPPVVIKVSIFSDQPPFSRGKLLRDLRCRWAAVACDAAMLMLVAVTMLLVLDSIWTSFAITIACYYLGSVLVLGNTPGICLCAPIDRARSLAQSMPRASSAASQTAST